MDGGGKGGVCLWTVAGNAQLVYHATLVRATLLYERVILSNRLLNRFINLEISYGH